MNSVTSYHPDSVTRGKLDDKHKRKKEINK